MIAIMTTIECSTLKMTALLKGLIRYFRRLASYDEEEYGEDNSEVIAASALSMKCRPVPGCCPSYPAAV